MKKFSVIFKNFKKGLTKEQLKKFKECAFDPEFLKFIWEEDAKGNEKRFKTIVLGEMKELTKKREIANEV